MRRALALFIAAVTGLLLLTTGQASAQDSTTISNGIIVGVQTNDNGELVQFALSDQGGNVTTFTVQPSTEYGLDNQAGDRWTSTQGEEPVEAAERLREHQQRFAAVTVTSENGVATGVVEKESGKLETNLAFLFAVFAVTWAGFFAYIFYMSRKQRDLQREIARLKVSLEEETDD